MRILSIFFLFFNLACSQSRFHNCPMEGDAKDDKTQAQNRLKNRYEVSAMEIRDIPFRDFVHAKDDAFDHSDLATLTAYVYGVKLSGRESCECHDNRASSRDYHITLTADAEHTQGKDRVIVEITGRWRAKHPEWNLATLKKTILHHMVTFSGYLFDDIQHRPEAFSDSPKNKRDWRGSIWELHPVIDWEVVK